MKHSSKTSGAPRCYREVRLLCAALVSAALMIVGPGCAWVSSTTSTTATAGAKPRFTDPDDTIRVAVFRYQFEHNASGQQKNAGVYCLSVSLTGQDEMDPSDELMRAFATHTPPVQKRSQCQRSTDGVFDGQTSRRGLIFYVSHIERVNETEVVVLGGYYEGGLSASGNAYHVVKRGDEWVVDSDQMHWIS